MSPILWAALSVLVLAYAYRERGQGHGWLGTTGARVLFWAVPVGAVVFALPVQPNPAGVWPAVLAGAMAFIGIVERCAWVAFQSEKGARGGTLMAGKMHESDAPSTTGSLSHPLSWVRKPPIQHDRLRKRLHKGGGSCTQSRPSQRIRRKRPHRGGRFKLMDSDTYLGFVR